MIGPKLIVRLKAINNRLLSYETTDQ